MVGIELPRDFKEFLKLLNENNVEYLLIGGYAVGYYGYPRTTADMDIWVSSTSTNAERLVRVFQEFGMVSYEITPELFLTSGNIVRMGVPPVRIEIFNDVDGVEFSECVSKANDVVIDTVHVRLISLADLRQNKKISGRYKDLDDLDHLPESE